MDGCAICKKTIHSPVEGGPLCGGGHCEEGFASFRAEKNREGKPSSASGATQPHSANSPLSPQGASSDQQVAKILGQQKEESAQGSYMIVSGVVLLGTSLYQMVAHPDKEGFMYEKAWMLALLYVFVGIYRKVASGETAGKRMQNISKGDRS